MQIPQFLKLESYINGQKVEVFFTENFVRVKGECVTLDLTYTQFIDGDWRSMLNCEE